MIVNNLYVSRPRGFFGPLKAHPPLVIDPYAVLPFALSFQSFKAIAGQSYQIPHGGCGFKTVELQPRSPFNTEERFNSLSLRDLSKDPARLVQSCGKAWSVLHNRVGGGDTAPLDRNRFQFAWLDSKSSQDRRRYLRGSRCSLHYVGIDFWV